MVQFVRQRETHDGRWCVEVGLVGSVGWWSFGDLHCGDGFHRHLQSDGEEGHGQADWRPGNGVGDPIKGTPKESRDLFTIDLKEGKSVEIALKNGSRTELATVPNDGEEFRATTTGAAVTNGMSGLGGGFGTAGTLMSSPMTAATPQNLPVVQRHERDPSSWDWLQRSGFACIGQGERGSSDHERPRQPGVCTGKNVAMPKVPLLPGGEDR